MTDKRQDTQKAAGELQGRAHRRPDGTGHGEGDTTGHTRQPRNTQQEQASGGQAEGRQEGRNTDGLAPGGAVEGRTTAGREQGESRQTEKEYVIYLRERREKKHRRDSQKRASVCIYILPNIAAWWLFIALSFIYIKGVYCIYIIYIIYPRLMYTFLLKLMFVLDIHYYI